MTKSKEAALLRLALQIVRGISGAKTEHGNAVDVARILGAYRDRELEDQRQDLERRHQRELRKIKDAAISDLAECEGRYQREVDKIRGGALREIEAAQTEVQKFKDVARQEYERAEALAQRARAPEGA